MSKPSQVILVVEDQRQQQLAYGYLMKCGLNKHAVRIERSPAGEGSGENWVRKNFPKHVNAYHARQALTALIVMIDADTNTVQNRLTQLDYALRDEGKPIVTEGERIARLVPKRNVETWIRCLNGQPVDETLNYKMTGANWNELIPSAAKTLSEWKQMVEPPANCIDSLWSGIQELKRRSF